MQSALNCDDLETLQLRHLVLDDHVQWTTSKSLKKLSLWDCDIQTLKLTAAISLRQLRITLSEIRQLHVDRCPQLTSLEFLESDMGRVEVAHCQNLASIFAGFTRFDVVLMEQLAQLERLTIQEHSKVRELHLAQLPRLSSCSFWAAEITSDALTGLLDIPTLVMLDISGTPLQDDAALLISRMSQLRRLYTSSHFSRRGLSELQHLSNLKELLLYRNDNSDWTKEDAAMMFQNGAAVTVFP